MAKSRLEMRREVEAAEAQTKTTRKKAAKKATRKKTTTRRTREKAPERKRAVWVIYSSSMKEEGRFAYDEKDKAEEKLEALRQRGKRLYFMQMVKELISGEAGAVASDAPPEDADEAPDDAAASTEEAAAESGDDALDGLELDAEYSEDDDEEEEAEEEFEDDGE